MEKLTKEQAEQYLKMGGKIRSVIFQTDKSYILKKAGEEGLRKIEERAKELGVEIPYRTATATDWHPMGLRIISVLLAAEVLGWSEEETREMGRNAVKVSFIVKLFMKFFVSLEKFMVKVPYYWKMHYADAGDLEVVKIDRANKEVILYLKGIKFPRICLDYYEGYFQQMFEFVLGESKESKFVEKEDYYEYTVKW
jgi:hypothetical protein